MAGAPKPVKLSVDQFEEASGELQPVLEKLFGALNPFLNDIYTAVSGQLTISDNTLASAKEVKVTVPTTANVYPSAVYSTNAGQSIASGAPGVTVDFEDKSFDTHNAVTTGANWVFTVPAGCSGKYLVTSTIQFAFTGTAFATMADLHQSGLGHVFRLGRAEMTTGGMYSAGGSAIVDVTAGTTLFLKAQQNSGVNRALEASNQSNFISIARLYDSSSTPAAFSGSGWPIALKPDFTSTVKAVLLVKTEDLADGAVTTVAGTPAWYVSNGTVYVTRINDLVPGKTYKLTFLILG